MFPTITLHPMLGEIVAASVSSVEELMQHPLALPVAVGVVSVFLTILLFYNISESLKKRGAAEKGGESEVRRSARYGHRLSERPRLSLRGYLPKVQRTNLLLLFFQIIKG